MGIFARNPLRCQFFGTFYTDHTEFTKNAETSHKHWGSGKIDEKISNK